MANRTPRVLLIGPLPPPIGGTRVSFRHLVEFLSHRPELEIRVIELRPLRRNLLQSFFSAIALFVRLIRNIPRTDLVSLHCNPSAIPVLGVTVALLAKAARKPLMVRTFGGQAFLHEYRGIRRALTRWVLARTDLYLAQTKAQLAMFHDHGFECARWFPTSRPTQQQPLPSSSSDNCRRFVFCSHIKASKGIHELIEAAEQLGSEVVVDVYGPFREGMTEAIFRECRVVKYRGILPVDEVIPTLRGYDALLLPTYFEGEGYPGVIVEAYCAGIPVIATRWGMIPDVVPATAGILVEPKNAGALAKAMCALIQDASLFHGLRAGVAGIGTRYSLEFWALRFIEFCGALLATRTLPNDPDPDRDALDAEHTQ